MVERGKGVARAEETQRMKFFRYAEFDSPDDPGSGHNMNRDFLRMLDLCRERAGIPFVVTSGFRTKAHHASLRNQGYATVENSPHLLGMAADIRATTSTQRFKILNAAIAVGFTRIGIASDYIHLDNCGPDQGKTTNLVWVYD